MLRECVCVLLLGLCHLSGTNLHLFVCLPLHEL